jgi:hypothetical protein
MNSKAYRGIPVLLTSSVVVHDTGVALTDTNARVQFALESIAQWLRIDPEISIVVCDGSNFDFSRLVQEQFSSANIECLCFENNQMEVSRLGRGFGEGEIVKFSITNSKLIAAAGCFTKCSSKLWVSNYRQCMRDWNGQFLCQGIFRNVFSLFKRTTLSYIDTRFYVASCQYYRDHFQSAHCQVSKATGYSLEDSFLQQVCQRTLHQIFFNTTPVICGVGGGTGAYYKTSAVRMFKDKVRLRLVRLNKHFRPMFSNP